MQRDRFDDGRTDTDRRRFLQKVGTGAIAGGALWVAPQVVSGRTAFAAGSGASSSTTIAPGGPTSTTTTSTTVPQPAATGQWELRSVDTAPPARAWGGMTRTSVGSVVLFGGYGGSVLGDTWLWNGSSWSAYLPHTTAARQQALNLATDSSGQALRFGGANHPTTTHRLEMASHAWVLLNPAGDVPEGRANAAMAADGIGNVVLFGGGGKRALEPLLSDTWVWDGTSWAHQTATGASPTGRNLVSMAGDQSGHVVLFGGSGLYGAVFGDTWVWDTASGTWTEQDSSLPAPGARLNTMMAPDGKGNVVLFGGRGPDGSFLDDTWIWNFTTGWTEATVSGAIPTPRMAGQVAQQGSGATGNGSIVVFGGRLSDGSYTDETWVWTTS